MEMFFICCINSIILILRRLYILVPREKKNDSMKEFNVEVTSDDFSYKLH